MPLVEHSRMVSLLGLTAAARRRRRRPARAADGRGLGELPAAAPGRRPARARPPAPRDRWAARTRRCTARPTSCRPASTSTATASIAPRRWSAGAWPGTGPTGRGSSRWRPTSRRSATSTRCATGGAGAPAVGPPVPRPHDRPVLRRLRALLRRDRRVRPARPGRGGGTPPRRGRPGPRVGGPPLARRAAGGRAAGRAALRTRRARRGRAAAGGEPGAGRGERGRRLHDRDLRPAGADQGAPRRRGRRARSCSPRAPRSPSGSA